MSESMIRICYDIAKNYCTASMQYKDISRNCMYYIMRSISAKNIPKLQYGLFILVIRNRGERPFFFSHQWLTPSVATLGYYNHAEKVV